MSSAPLATSGQGPPTGDGAVSPEVSMVEATELLPTPQPQTFREKLLADHHLCSNLQWMILELFFRQTPRVQVDGKWYEISYENLPHICFECGHVGHNLTNCPNKEPQASKPVATVPTLETAAQSAQPTSHNLREETGCSDGESQRQKGHYGPWMVVQHRRKPPRAVTGEASTKKESATGKKSGSRFDILSDYEILARPPSQPSADQPTASTAPSTISPSIETAGVINTPAKATPSSGVAIPISTSTKSVILNPTLNGNKQVQSNDINKVSMQGQGVTSTHKTTAESGLSPHPHSEAPQGKS
ncbi:hypothetical protein Tsubulata_020137 [Turnera subulata]|uniref:CCHC-type domain-containing protein n=1 Tax=Turnera subulata TaxID=218843 RepID=A0A9Q0JHJ1_9ROSI|nr:hypothetical protein Tsubulata_020137 [Turnera subulata]